MKETTIFNSSINLYNNSTNLNLFESIKGFFKENNNNSSEKKIKFFKELSKVLEDKLILTIRLHQIGYNNIRQKLLSEKNFILNSLSAEVKNMTINQFIQFLKSLKEQPQDKHFSIGKNIINNNRIPMEIKTTPIILSFVIFSLKNIRPANTERIKGKASDIGDNTTRGKYLINKEFIISTAKNKE